MDELNKVLSKNKLLNFSFIEDINKIIQEKELSYIDAVVYYCEKNNVEIETIASLVKQNAKLKSEIMIEAEKLNMMKDNNIVRLV